MDEGDSTRAKLIELIKELRLEPGVPLSLYEIGPPLVGQGISQDSIVNALYALEDEGVIDLLGNRLVLLKNVE
jgi:DNA-binding GntR family transcriptional regulator